MKIENYPEWLVPLGIAEKLKEIGFRMCTTDFYEGGRGEGRFKTNLDINFNNLKSANHNAYNDYMAIPNYTQVFDWFRRKKLFGIIDCNGSSSYSYRILIMETPFVAVVSDDKTYPIYHFCREALVNRLIEEYKKLNRSK